MCNPDATNEEVSKAGIRLFVILYGGKNGESINELRYAKFMEMISSPRNVLEPQKLPPTERAAYYHSFRVHCQVIIWIKLNVDALDPRLWGWTLQDNEYSPVQTDKDVAPKNLLKFVRCKCKLTSRNPCGTNTCSCRKNGLKCVTACGDCRECGCNNAQEVIFGLEEDPVEVGLELELSV